MRTTLTIDTPLFEEASKLTGISEKGKLIREALNALIARESGKRLAKLGGTAPDMKSIPRRRSKP
ncbi:type II toxin-antitoxin system VapB family antitoxin [Oceaniferula spumae]